MPRRRLNAYPQQGGLDILTFPGNTFWSRIAILGMLAACPATTALAQDRHPCFPGAPPGSLEAECGHETRIWPASIFGDSNPSNGDEDNRLGFTAPAWRRPGLPAKNPGVGSVYCDGKVRGTATVVDLEEPVHGIRGLVLATAAHVLYDLRSGEPFGECEFRFRETGRWRNHRLPIDLERKVLGTFNPATPGTGPALGAGDWAFLYVPGRVPAPLDRRGFRLRAFSPAQSGGVTYSLVAYHDRRDEILISPDCRVIESGPNDIGGGSWPGQLLDDCDSGGGASGGALVVTVSGQNYLVGMRVGAYWDKYVFPDGPPNGAAWDPRTNTNFSRAVDAQMVEALRRFVRSLADAPSSQAVL
jgi:hypothetical protein